MPQVVLPQGADNFVNGELLARAGAGVSIEPQNLNPGAVRDAVRLMLADVSYRGAARRLAQELAALPEPSEVARELRDRIGRD